MGLEKKTAGTKQALDSILYSDNTKYVYTYTARGEERTFTQYHKDSISGAWIPQYTTIHEYLYDATGTHSTTTHSNWVASIGTWRESERYYSTVDLRGNYVSESSEYFSQGSGTWAPSYRGTFSYDAQGNDSNSASYKWNASSAAWDSSSKEIVTGTVNGIRTSIYSSRDTAQAAWIPSSKSEEAFDASGNETARINYNWNSSIGIWAPWYKSETTFDLNRNELSDIGYQWNTEFGIWAPNSKYETTFDSQGNDVLSISYTWNAAYGQWAPSSKQVDTYDLSVSVADVISDGEWVHDCKNKRLALYNFDWNTSAGDWVSSNRDYILYYSPYTSAIRPFSAPSGALVTLHCSSDAIHLSWPSPDRKTVQLYGVSGRLLRSETMYSSGYIPTADLAPALHIISVSGMHGERELFKILTH